MSVSSSSSLSHKSCPPSILGNNGKALAQTNVPHCVLLRNEQTGELRLERLTMDVIQVMHVSTGNEEKNKEKQKEKRGMRSETKAQDILKVGGVKKPNLLNLKQNERPKSTLSNSNKRDKKNPSGGTKLAVGAPAAFYNVIR